MIIREATRDDLRPLLHLCKKVWTQLGVPFDTSLDRFGALKAQRFRIVVLYEDTAMLAALVAHPIETDRGPGFEIKTFVVDQDHPDKTRFADALSLYAMNIGASEGRHIVVTRRPRAIKGALYGRDQLGIDATQGDDAYILQIGHSADMMRRILERRPEWRTSLSSVTAT